jgi:hypothetical protein
MSSKLMKAAVTAFGVLLWQVPGNTQDAAQIEGKRSSIVYYGQGLNQRTDKEQYRANQEQALDRQQHSTNGRQGQHLARMEMARRQSSATGYGDISDVTGNRRTKYVGGYTRADGKRVRPHFRSTR